MYSSNILDYHGKAYQNEYETEFITGFTHTNLAVGKIDPQKSKKIVDKLNLRSYQVMPCITFNKEMLRGEQLTGGACSAIAFRVAKEALSLLTSLQENKQLTPFQRELSFTTHLTKFIHILESIATGNAQEEKKEQEEIRSEQSALNTITVDRNAIQPGNNAVAEKVSAMASFYGLKVMESSPSLRVKGNDQLENQLAKEMQDLKEGVYFLRIIIEEYNHKLEQQGHSIIYIKTANAEYYFDAALGFYHLFHEAMKTHIVYNALLSANKKFGVDVLSFHRLMEENPLSSESFTAKDLNLKGILYIPHQSLEACPVILFSPSLGQPISEYKKMAQELSSRGFRLMCVDHLETGVQTPKLEEKEIIARGLQNGYNLAKLSELIRNGHFVNIPKNAPMGVLGHSLGGSASLEACRKTHEIFAAVNMDGRIIRPRDIVQPVLQLVAKQVKEDRTKYKEALEELSKINPFLIQKEVSCKHGDFSSSYSYLLNYLLDECDDFFKKYLV